MPTPWECWFCNKAFGTYKLAHEHETQCSRLHGWEINEEEAERFAQNNPNTCQGGEKGIHSVECVAKRVPFAWVRVAEDLEFDAGAQASVRSDWMTGSGGVADGEDMADIEDVGQAGERPLEAQQVYAQFEAAHSRAAQRRKGEFVGGGWSKMARNTRKRQENLGWWSGEQVQGGGESKPRARGARVEAAAAALDAHGGAAEPVKVPELREVEQFPVKRGRQLERVLEATHGVLPFNFSAVDNGTRPVGVPTLASLAQLPEYLRDPDTHHRWKWGEDVLPPEMERQLGVGSDLKSQLGKKDLRRLGGAEEGEVTSQASSILRKKSIANMNKDMVMARLEEINVRFDEACGVATLRGLLVGKCPGPLVCGIARWAAEGGGAGAQSARLPPCLSTLLASRPVEHERFVRAQGLELRGGAAELRSGCGAVGWGDWWCAPWHGRRRDRARSRPQAQELEAAKGPPLRAAARAPRLATCQR